MISIDFTDRYKINRPRFTVRIVNYIKETCPAKPKKDDSIYKAIVPEARAGQLAVSTGAGIMWIDTS